MGLLQQDQICEGAVLGAYRILGRIGIGGMGTVYEAEHVGFNKRVAIKTLNGQMAANPEARARFVREGRTASKIRHPHVVDVTDVGQEGQVAFMVMEFLEGKSLATVLRTEGALPAQRVANLLVPVVAALDEAHRQDVVHRDLKPDNIFLTRSVTGTVHPKVLDFGISKVLGESGVPNLTTANLLLGTPHYMSPEQVTGSSELGPKSDQYSLGVLLYEAATGVNPFEGRVPLLSVLQAISTADFAGPRQVVRTIDERLEALLLRAMSLSPDDRYPSMRALGTDFVALASEDTRTTWVRYFDGLQEPATRDSSEAQRRPSILGVGFEVLGLKPRRLKRRVFAVALLLTTLCGWLGLRGTSRAPLVEIQRAALNPFAADSAVLKPVARQAASPTLSDSKRAIDKPLPPPVVAQSPKIHRAAAVGGQRHRKGKPPAQLTLRRRRKPPTRVGRQQKDSRSQAKIVQSPPDRVSDAPTAKPRVQIIGTETPRVRLLK